MEKLSRWFPQLSPEKIEKLDLFEKELKKFNPRLNLVSPNTIDNAEELHFADSILAAEKILKELKDEPLFDIGSGNGFPGLILALLSDDHPATLVESDRRKSEFIKHVISVLGLKNTDVHTGRFEELPNDSISFATCRAFAPLERCLKWAESPLKSRATFFHLKGSNWQSEIAQTNKDNWSIELFSEFSLPESKDSRVILKTTKL